MKGGMPDRSPSVTGNSVSLPGFAQALRFWIKLGFISFGGPAGQIAIMHKELVEKKRWISDGHFLHALNFCMLLPGPEAQQLATYLGWRLHGAKGGIAAGVWFVLPSVFILYGLSWLYVAGGHLPWLAAIFHGLLAAVIAVVAEAVLRIGKKALRSPGLWVIAILSFGAIYFLGVSFVYIILGAAAIGWMGHHFLPLQFPGGKGHAAVSEKDGTEEVQLAQVQSATVGRTIRVVAVSFRIWSLAIFALALWLGWESTPVQQGIFFSKAALVTFGGAYAVLPYVAQQAVENYAWLSHPQMMSGLALAETTPGPLIMVLQFVGFVGGWQHPGALSPLAAATVGALITTWVTFVPCFLFVFLGAPHVEQLGEHPRLSAAMTAITAAVVGVILNLGVHFVHHAVWPTALGGLEGSFDLTIAVLSVLAFLAMKRFKAGLLPVIAGCGTAGWVNSLI